MIIMHIYLTDIDRDIGHTIKCWKNSTQIINN